MLRLLARFVLYFNIADGAIAINHKNMYLCIYSLFDTKNGVIAFFSCRVLLQFCPVAFVIYLFIYFLLSHRKTFIMVIFSAFNENVFRVFRPIEKPSFKIVSGCA